MSVRKWLVPRHERHGAFAVLAAFSIVAASCTDQKAMAPSGPTIPRSARLTQVPPPPQPFTWLAPLGNGTANPATFDPNVNPRIEICVWVSGACSGGLVATFATPPVAGSGAINVNTVAGQYEASWNLLNTAFLTRKTYRIRVLEGTTAVTEMGAISVDVVRGRWALTRSDGTLAPLVSAASLPIVFHIAQLNCINLTSCASEIVPAVIPAGTTVTVKTNDGKHWITFQGDANGNWNTAGTSAIVTVEDVSAQLGGSIAGCNQGITDMVIQGNCIKITTSPTITLSTPAVVCMTLDAFRSEWQMVKYDAGQPPRSEFLADPPDNTCPETGRIAMRQLPSNPLLRLAAQAGDAVVDLLTPKLAYGFDAGVGGTINVGDGFSFFAPGLAAQIQVLAGDNQTANPNSAVATPPTVQIINTHEGRNTPIGGAIVTCTITSGGGLLATTSGLATESPTGTYTCPTWTLGDATGTNTLSVTSNITDAYNTRGNVLFTATAGSANDAVLGVSVDPQGAGVVVGKTFQITPTVTVTGNAPQTVTWNSTNAAVATVSSSGLVTPVAPGSASIIATSTFNPKQVAATKVVVSSVPLKSPYISSLLISKATFRLGLSQAGIWTATLENPFATQTGVSLVGFIQQGDNSVGVSNGTVFCPGLDRSLLPSGSCIQQGTYMSVGPDGGTDGLVPGLANFAFEMIQNGDVVRDTKTIPVTLLNAP